MKPFRLSDFDFKKYRYRYKVKLPGLLQLALALILFCLQLTAIYYLVTFFETQSYVLLLATQIISLLLALYMVRKDRNPNYALSWTIILLVIPSAGWLMFFLWGRNAKFKKAKESVVSVNSALSPLISQNNLLLKELEKRDRYRLLQARYLANKGFPLYQNTNCEYYPLGELQLEQLFRDLASAKRFIFMEYFIIADGFLWNRLRELLIAKAKEGVEIRLMFDDFGSVLKAPRNIISDLSSHGIQIVKFNPVLRYISKLYLNYRNHQKIAVIDGDIGHTGGINFADEYANIHRRFGHWKDTGIRLTGDAVWGLTTTFLTMWEMEKHKDSKQINLDTESYRKYMPNSLGADSVCNNTNDFFIPYWDGPYNNPDNPSEEVYVSMINTAVKSIYITTPYFIVDDAMIQDLCRAAEAGVDVNLILPGKPDKKIVFAVTRSYYLRLLQSGVKIYEYTPGFIHAKTMLVDDEHLVIGSINFDFRSFNLLYENAVWIHSKDISGVVKQDILATISKCQKIELNEWQQRSMLLQNILDPFFRILAPML